MARYHLLLPQSNLIYSLCAHSYGEVEFNGDDLDPTHDVTFSSRHAEGLPPADAYEILLSLLGLFASGRKFLGQLPTSEDEEEYMEEWKPRSFYSLVDGHISYLPMPRLKPSSGYYTYPFTAVTLVPEQENRDWYLSLARMNSDFLKILRLLRREANWDDLYRIYEIIEQVTPEEQHNEVFISGTQLRRFKGSANNVMISGDGARHAQEYGGAPAQFMTLSEAEVYIYAAVHEGMRLYYIRNGNRDFL